jgi:hypothetical protein
MNKILNVLGNIMLFGGWFIFIIFLLILDGLQLDALVDQEIGGVFYIGFTTVYFVGYWLLSKFGLLSSDVAGDTMDFFD